MLIYCKTDTHTNTSLFLIFWNSKPLNIKVHAVFIFWCLTSVNKTSSSCNHFDANDRISLFTVNNILIYTAHFLYPFIDGNHSHWLRILSVVNSATINMVMWGSLWNNRAMLLEHLYPEMGFLNRMASMC